MFYVRSGRYCVLQGTETRWSEAAVVVFVPIGGREDLRVLNSSRNEIPSVPSHFVVILVINK